MNITSTQIKQNNSEYKQINKIKKRLLYIKNKQNNVQQSKHINNIRT